DRDGTIIFDRGYLKAADEVCLLAGAGAALAAIQERGFALVLISNQSGIGRGLITPQQAEEVHETIVAQLREYGVRLEAACYCPHTPDEKCRCRKPSPEMIVRAARDLHLDRRRSFMIGDKACDIEAGQRAGCRTILFVNRAVPAFAEPRPDLVAQNWNEVLGHILGTGGISA
ncbi:MAG TPA: HAD-IIIA family hydrolase, partial [Gemmataceae bacterium]|nr:HAD-IIIA family hydrolase [Gemmataceae bacterium]